MKWIDVNERMPEEFGRYIVCTTDGVVDVCDFCRKEEWKTDPPIFHQWDSEEWICWEPEVVAWMPLPEPWKGEKNEIDRCRGIDKEPDTRPESREDDEWDKAVSVLWW